MRMKGSSGNTARPVQLCPGLPTSPQVPDKRKPKFYSCCPFLHYRPICGLQPWQKVLRSGIRPFLSLVFMTSTTCFEARECSVPPQALPLTLSTHSMQTTKTLLHKPNISTVPPMNSLKRRLFLSTNDTGVRLCVLLGESTVSNKHETVRSSACQDQLVERPEVLKLRIFK